MSERPQNPAAAGLGEIDDHVAKRVLLVAYPEGADALASFHLDLVEVVAEVLFPGGQRRAGLI
jgi:hypothetical protein